MEISNWSIEDLRPYRSHVLTLHDAVEIIHRIVPICGVLESGRALHRPAPESDGLTTREHAPQPDTRVDDPWGNVLMNEFTGG